MRESGSVPRPLAIYAWNRDAKTYRPVSSLESASTAIFARGNGGGPPSSLVRSPMSPYYAMPSPGPVNQPQMMIQQNYGEPSTSQWAPDAFAASPPAVRAVLSPSESPPSPPSQAFSLSRRGAVQRGGGVPPTLHRRNSASGWSAWSRWSKTAASATESMRSWQFPLPPVRALDVRGVGKRSSELIPKFEAEAV